MYELIWAQVGIAYLLDIAFGEPKRIPHPVVVIGRLIAFLERMLNRNYARAIVKKLSGVFLVTIVVGLTYAATWAIVWSASSYNRHFGVVISALLLSMTLATRGLTDSARAVARALATVDLEQARSQVARIVGRDTASMKRRDIVRATVESVAENTVDAVIAPILYGLLGGAPLAMAYKAVNTLDSMVGYKNERYIDFGWAAARLDDIANYIPARITVAAVALGALFTGKRAGKAVRVAIRDGRNHASINSGYPEAAVAGAVGVRLGGVNYYQGIARSTAVIGDAKGALTEKHIHEAVLLLFTASAITLLAARIGIFIYSYVTTGRII